MMRRPRRRRSRCERGSWHASALDPRELDRALTHYLRSLHRRRKIERTLSTADCWCRSSNRPSNIYLIIDSGVHRIVMMPPYFVRCPVAGCPYRMALLHTAPSVSGEEEDLGQKAGASSSCLLLAPQEGAESASSVGPFLASSASSHLPMASRQDPRARPPFRLSTSSATVGGEQKGAPGCGSEAPSMRRGVARLCARSRGEIERMPIVCIA
jgi:hypothetical protein